MLQKFSHFAVFSALFGFFTYLFLTDWVQRSIRPVEPVTARSAPNKHEELREIFTNLIPQNGDCGLLLAFDTDVSQDRQSYTQYYDHFEKSEVKPPTNRTLYLTRKRDTVEIATELNYIASPQKNGFVFLGQARYFEPKPRDKNKDLDKLEQEGSLRNFGFDYSRIWMTRSTANIGEAKAAVIKATKNAIDKEYRNLKPEEREYHRNITDYEKVSFVSNGYYIVDGFWSLVHGGAAWFEANEKSRLVPIYGSGISGRLHNWYSQNDILRTFKSAFDRNYRNSEDAKYNNMDYFWQTWKDRLSLKFDIVPTFTLERRNATSHLIGLVLVDGNTHRSFNATADFGKPPKKLVAYDNPPLDFEKLFDLYPGTIDAFVSPKQNTVFVLTDKEIICLDVSSAKEIYRTSHGLKFNKVVMVEWAVNEYVEKWELALAN